MKKINLDNQFHIPFDIGCLNRFLLNVSCLLLLIGFSQCGPAQISRTDPIWYKYDDNDPVIKYYGGWDTVCNDMCYRGSQHVSKEEGAEAIFSFNGTKMRIYGSFGNGEVYIDDIKYGNLNKGWPPPDWFNHSPQYQYILFVADSLKDGKHVAKIKGKGIIFDSFSILSDTLITFSKNSSPEAISESLGQTSVPQPLWKKIDDSDKSVTYKGKWVLVSNTLCHQGSQQKSTATGAEVNLKFNGFKVRIYGSRNINHGKALIYIDDVLRDSIDCYSSVPKYNEVLYESDSIKMGTHLLRIVGKSNSSNKSAEFGFDAFSSLSNRTYSLITVSVDNKPLIDANYLDSMDVKKGFEGGTIISYKNEYRFFTHEIDGSFGGFEKMGLYKSTDGTKWERIKSVTPDSTRKQIPHEKPWQDCWEPFPNFNEKEGRWNLFYNSNMKIIRAVSQTAGYDGIEGPYQDVQDIIKYGYPEDPQPSDPWECSLIWSWCHYPVKGDTLYAIYGSFGRMGNRIGLARSNTGMTGPWSRVSDLNPIETGAVACTENPLVFKLDDGNYIALADGADYEQFGTPRGICAFMSYDGIHWGKITYFDLWKRPGRWWKMLRTPLSFIKQPNENYLMYFSAFANDSIEGYPDQNFKGKETLGRSFVSLKINEL